MYCHSDLEEIIRFAKIVEPNFGAVNIEDIESPKVLKIVELLTRELSIPVFHDDQHGTAVIALAALINALKLVQKRLTDIRITITEDYSYWKIGLQQSSK